MYNMLHVVCKANVLFDNALYVDIENKGKGSRSNCGGQRAVGGMYNACHVVRKVNVLFDNALYVNFQNKGNNGSRSNCSGRREAGAGCAARR